MKILVTPSASYFTIKSDGKNHYQHFVVDAAIKNNFKVVEPPKFRSIFNVCKLLILAVISEQFVVMQGRSLFYGFFRLFFKRKGLIVYTWVIPGIGVRSSFTSRLYHFVLRYVMKRSKIVVSSKHQQEVLAIQGYRNVYLWFVYAQNNYWRDLSVSKLSICEPYCLVVGGNDRNERLGLELAQKLGCILYRVSKDKGVLRNFENLAGEYSFTVRSLHNVSDDVLKYLYQNARWVFCFTDTSTNPAGLTAVTEAAACGARLVSDNTVIVHYFSEHSVLYFRGDITLEEISGILSSSFIHDTYFRAMARVESSNLERLALESFSDCFEEK